MNVTKSPPDHNAAAPKARGWRRWSTRKKALVVAVALALAGTQAAVTLPAHATLSAMPSHTSAATNGPVGFAALARKVRPAVVTVAIEGEMHANAQSGPPLNLPQFPPGTPFGDLFRHFFEQRGIPGGQGPEEEIHALGSGFIIDPSGYIVTNNHVVDHADKITVILDTGRRYRAKLIGRDPKTDLALIKIHAHHPLPHIRFGNSNAANVGDWVMAVGNPFGLGGTVTAGIISARGRNIRSGPYDDYLQIDAPINRGNSGGPLIDMHGNVIGINTAIWTPTGGNVGIGFAIPSNEAQPIVAQLRAHGKVVRGYLGVEIQPVTRNVADSLGMNRAGGALVAEVTNDSPAARAGLQAGDVITAVNGKPVKAFRDLPWLIANIKPGATATLTVWRNGKNHTLEASIGSLHGASVQAENNGSNSGATPAGELGLEIAPLTPAARQHFGINDNTQGVLVAGVRSGSPAAEAGMQAGDVITMAGQHRVYRPAQLAKAVHAAAREKHHSVLLLVDNHGQTRFMAIPFAG